MKPFLHLRNNTHRVAPYWILPLLMAASIGVAQAQSGIRHSDVERELKQSRFDQVLDLTQKALSERPRDPQMRFWHALALDQLGRGPEALQAYQSLAQDHPELPEPHNNLGVLLLRQGQIDEAQEAFQMALRMDTAYAEAMENLGDVLLLQARKLYEKSLEINAQRPVLREKINALPSLPPRKTP
jgi:Flp pilus assembly protein TadD